MNKQTNIFDSSSLLCKSNIDKPAILRDLPFEKIYHAARKEASRKKPVFFIHKYFARRITANFRMILLGLTLPYESDIWDSFYNSFEEGIDGNVTVLDPFMGGGTTLFEALRLGFKVIGNDLQPLSNFVTRALVADVDEKSIRKQIKKLEASVGKSIMEHYTTVCPECKKHADVMYNFHVKKVRTKSSCGEHKLYSGFVLSYKNNIFTLVCPSCNDVFKSTFSEGYAKCNCGYIINNPKDSFVEKGKFTCNKCDESIVLSSLKREDGYPLETDVIAQEYYCTHCKSHDYKRIDDFDKELLKKSNLMYDSISHTLPIPYQKIPKGYNTNQIINHGYEYFSELFNKRQLLTLGLLLQEINKIEDKEVKIWLQLAFSGMLEMNNMFCRYQHNASKISNIFFNHAYVPITMPVENNVWGSKLGTGNFIKTIDKILRGKDFNKNIYDLSSITNKTKIDSVKVESKEVVDAHPVNSFNKLNVNSPLITCGDSRNLTHIPNNSVDIVLTDPPYGSNVMYSELIDFFHVWNHMSNIGRELGFETPLSPKVDEIIVNKVQNKTFDDYKDGLTAVFKECYRVTKSNGYLVFSFHDKSLESWISILNSINDSGFELIKSYPMHSETRTGAHTSNKNSIAFDIMLICSKKESSDLNNYSFEDIHEIVKESFVNTEEVLKRLFSVNAEVTLPDVENFFISEFFSICTHKKIHIDSFSEIMLTELRNSISRIDNYFSEYDISSIRTGWWSELYNSKWNITLK